MAQLQRLTIQASQLQQNQVLLTPQQKHYLLRVLRLQDGDEFISMDGMGKWWLTRLTADTAQILQPLTPKTELPLSITLMLALPKGNAFDDVVRYSTELGVSSILPVLSDRTLLNPSPQRLERWRRIAAEAAEQSERAFVPTILEPVVFNAALSEYINSQCYICEARGSYPHLINIINIPLKNIKEVVVAIGPEGGWTETEIATAILAKFQPVSLGDRILRAATAPIVALSLIAAACEIPFPTTPQEVFLD
ncbi:16S rRNA (uracil(1498)-N(3))-methyltransferase [Cylindrospermopsis raciborskii S07]|uniref:Ribosomal RNA small subunit methyltransferase E n=1 Tax=Cylindrospermopsis raciborskii C07 TaxID=2014886 RepID=A0ABX4WPF9_9CYAN|nr:16S rRNA (uracil(1498)-N(3))-methyltransferase [Cylindrospermopsis raciborskii]PNJ97879.1 16S rRNA (uracil(1498)-N(3))-methyltransferase [Cylindrospermopsis raciborskii C03]PNJ99420.1 16S rRNA (uracil(1498)-N(3))-methyltransferase [Cylindrospermopsis raciborskii C04]PNK00426.1 16S rRNA (uracil(1498)-N(3))-methyltransferase [Cylindrospermopsis raciborskii C07]PNK01315.1 16S rRNA (uracil(1498)-N(3))-methyltransferase [Cylindrospermopsis raciborskii S10]PNK08369.1 16S rRNA (uracil(1498)-N(3))-